MEARLTICNMSIEGGARVGYISPDETTFDYLKGQRFAPAGADFDRARQVLEGDRLGRGRGLRRRLRAGRRLARADGRLGHQPRPGRRRDGQAARGPKRPPRRTATSWKRPTQFTGFKAGAPIGGQKIDVAFIGSCTNGRISRPARGGAGRAGQARVGARQGARGAGLARAVARQAEAEGLDEIFREAGFEWRGAGCSMCLGMNPDVLVGPQVCASSSNRNFIGRQGSPNGQDAPHEPRHGRRGGDRRRGRRTCARWSGGG